ncbi:MAG: hypothetical protein K8T91_02045 [Planctomycetes bacterium]|nr:hypothetical protein [Planctomycetota bacterium]
MASSVDELLSSFDRLSELEQVKVAKEIRLRLNRKEDASLCEEMTASAAEVFKMFDEAEEKSGKAETW